MKLSRVHITAAILFLGLAASYACLSPGSIAGQGYTGEEIDSGLRMLEVSNSWLKGRVAPPMVWSRHGPVPVLFDLPFLKLGKISTSPDFMLSFEPALLTAALVAILYLWLRKLCSPGMSLFLALTAAFGTMLWPYAYIGLETKQSLFVFLAGYLALSGGPIRRWPRFLLFALTCALSLSVKSTGVALWPVVAYLVYVQTREGWRARRSQLAVMVVIIAAVWALGHWGSNQYWGPRGGGAGSFRQWMIDSPLQFFINLVGIFGSPSKGLFVYAPVLLASLYAVPRAYRSQHRSVAIFAVLVNVCTLALICLLTSPADEVWGPRYLHVGIAPLIVCIGAAFPRFEWRRHYALAVLAVVGVAVSFLGAFYYYGVVNFAAAKEGQNAMEWLTGDGSWNPIEFDARLFRVWAFRGGDTPVMWAPKHTWVWTPPADAPPVKAVDLREYSQPQSFLLRFWHIPKSGVAVGIFDTYVFSLLLGVVLLAWAILRTARDQRAYSREFILETEPALAH